MNTTNLPLAKFFFENGKKSAGPIGADTSAVAEPWVYVWVDAESSRAVYVGEYGKSRKYTLERRLEYSIGAVSHNTECQLKNNSGVTGFDINRPLVVIAVHLPEEAKEDKVRTSVESWLHWLITVVHCRHHSQYCGFNYTIPDAAQRALALSVYRRIAQELGWPHFALHVRCSN